MTHMEREARLLEICERIARGEPVDWAAPEVSDPELLPEAKALQDVERVVRGYRESGPSTPPTKPIGSWGHLRLLEAVARAPLAEVYRAFDPHLEREVALKLFTATRLQGDPIALDRSLHEARQLAKIRHRNVLAVYGADVHDERAGVWTELIRGKTLEAHLGTDGPFSFEEATRVGVEICRALAQVHAVGLVHQDVKASNVMREEGGRIVLMDFGCASARGAKTGEGATYGTPITSAPETLQGKPPSKASDIYALGVLLYRLVTRRYPVEASTLAELLEMHGRGERHRVREIRPEIPESFAAVIEKALEPHPERRFSSAVDFERALIQARQGATAGLRMALPSNVGVARRRRFAMAGIAALAIAIGIASLVVVLRLNRRGSQMSPPTSSASVPLLPTGASAPSASLLLDRNAAVTPLEDGDRIRPGDGIFLDFTGTMPLWTYVINRDQTGSLFVLFPLRGFDLQNPLPPGVRHRLPGKRGDVLQSWKVSNAGGEEEFIVISTRTRRPELEKALSTLQSAVPEVDAPEGVRLRGVGQTTPSPTPDPPEASRLLPESLRAILDASAPADPGVWVRRFRLRNPASP